MVLGPPARASRSIVRPGVVRRDRLVREFAAVPDDASLIMVVAGAGYGKTTALGQWAAEDVRTFGWLRLESPDGDPIHLLRRVADTLQESLPSTVRCGTPSPRRASHRSVLWYPG